MAEDTIIPTLLIDSTYRVQIEDVEAYRALASRMAKDATRCDSCVFLKVAQDASDPTTFYLFEGWRDQEALDAHLASEEFQSVMREAGKLKIADRFADIYAVSSRKPLEMPF